MSGESWLLLLRFHILTMSEIRLCAHPRPVYDTNRLARLFVESTIDGAKRF